MKITWTGVLPYYSSVLCLVKFWGVVIGILHMYCNSVWTFYYVSIFIQAFHLDLEKEGTTKKYFHVDKSKDINEHEDAKCQVIFTVTQIW